MVPTATISIIKKLGNSVREVARSKSSSWWYTPHMAAASHAIAERIPLVDFILEVRDARIPLSSQCIQVGGLLPSSRHIIVLNKIDLAKQSEIKEWAKYFDQRHFTCFQVNAHNKENIREFLNFLQARAKKLIKNPERGGRITLMLVGIPNVGKSALANSLHQIGRISAAEKGKLRHATVSSQPGETKNIIGLKIASHPNIYVLDTPGILPPEIFDDELCSKLALTGSLMDFIVGEAELARYFLAVFNLSKEYSKWAKFSAREKDGCSTHSEGDENSHVHKRRKRRFASDHTQDFIVNDVRRTLFEAVSSFGGNLEDDEDFIRLIDAELSLLRRAFRLAPELEETNNRKVATKLLDLYRTGKLGQYALDTIPTSL